jgi:uncharacterized membrane protein YhaH (DUF805 family)
MTIKNTVLTALFMLGFMIAVSVSHLVGCLVMAVIYLVTVWDFLYVQLKPIIDSAKREWREWKEEDARKLG